MDKTEFHQILSSSPHPVLVDFWAPWCGPCRMTKPILEKLAREYSGQVDFLPINADESREILEQLRVLGIPTVIAFRGGKETGRVTGAQNEAGYRAVFAALVEGAPVRLPVAPFDRLLRLGAGMLLGMVGLSTGNWLVILAGGLVAFLGIYDRCPIWAAITGLFRRRA